jgi:hypothetical protein
MKNWIFALAILTACSSDPEGISSQKDERILPSSTGTHSEMLIVVDNELWDGQLGKDLRDAFSVTQYGLPQNEPIFRLAQLDPSELSTVMKRSKSLLWVEVADTQYYSVARNVFAKPQLMATVIGKSPKDVSRIVAAKAPEIIASFRKSDREILTARLKKSSYKQLPDALKDVGIEKMVLLKGFQNTVNNDEVKIFWLDGVKTTQGLLVTRRPAMDNILPGQDIVSFRDSLTKKYIQGENDESYVAIEKLIPPLQTNTEIDGHFAIETRGLWQTEGDFMGGPFLSYSIYLDETDEVVTLDAFVYGPEAKKRPIMLELEAMMKSVHIK